jgi:hypothetical protein
VCSALKLRYLIPLVTPAAPAAPSGPGSAIVSAATPPPSARARSFRTPELPVYFDALQVARRDAGWEDVLEAALLRWVQAVVDEARGER